MKKLNNIKTLTKLLEQLKKEASPLLVRLSSRAGNTNFLMDTIVKKVKQHNQNKLTYVKLDATVSETIKQELQISKNPVLLLINQGQIKAIFTGMVAHFQLEEAIQALNQTKTNY